MRVLTTLLTMLKRNCSISNDYIRWVVAVYGFDVVDLRYAMKWRPSWRPLNAY